MTDALRVSGKAEIQVLCEDLAKLALEWARVFEDSDVFGAGGKRDVPLSAIRELGREIADRLEARWLLK